jgi:hypothetical protein
MDQLSSLQSSVVSLVKRFVGQQSIVLDAMRDLRPDIIMPLENHGSPEEWTNLKIKYSKKSQLGYWGDNDQWEYFLHGGGCKLTHRQTGEIIQWDAGDLNKFNVDWFVDYLQWALKQNTDEDIKTIHSIFEYIEAPTQQSREENLHQRLKLREQILPVLEQLHEKGLLNGNNQRTHYKLVMPV